MRHGVRGGDTGWGWVARHREEVDAEDACELGGARHQLHRLHHLVRARVRVRVRVRVSPNLNPNA